MAWSTDHQRYRGVPKPLAARIRRRDHHTCQRCGQPGHEVDHIRNVKAGGDDHPDNLQTLCTECHQAKTKAEAARGRARRSRRRPQPRHPGLLP
ncbi:HNH endonuclease [Rhodococcus aetherivorans]|uniref:HNH endonuclease n=1 Tax=Rhodococcus aetherivorans TaxID=191292 RepID=UPI00045C3BD0|nr:hypothetical protein N505_0105315 [Rhodococcus aetherivorans]